VSGALADDGLTNPAAVARPLPTRTIRRQGHHDHDKSRAVSVAATAWLAFGAVVTTLIRRFALPNPRELTH
jgi:hypothetical protein